MVSRTSSALFFCALFCWSCETRAVTRRCNCYRCLNRLIPTAPRLFANGSSILTDMNQRIDIPKVQPLPARTSWGVPRRIVAPELLECRNAPSPLLPLGNLFAPEVAIEVDLLADYEYRANLGWGLELVDEQEQLDQPPGIERLARFEQDGQLLTEVLEDSPLEQAASSSEFAPAVAVSLVPYEAAVISAALAAASAPVNPPDSMPPITQPVIMDPVVEIMA